MINQEVLKITLILKALSLGITIFRITASAALFLLIWLHKIPYLF
jgi:hypothetical protein